jgi:peptide chain release factor 2
MKALAAWREEVEEVEELELLAACGEEAQLLRGIEKVELKTFFSGKYDRSDAILAIHAGQGGVEAMDWTQMLQRMYQQYLEKRGWESKIVELTMGEEAGIKSVVMTVKGRFVYGFLKHEAGTHRLVRQSPFNADKLRQTSFALVEVLPQVEEGGEGEIKESDLEWSFTRASSHGGQNVQKVSTAVRLCHRPTGIIVSSQAQRYQEQNRKVALDILRAKLWALAEEKSRDEKQRLKGGRTQASWGTQIRSYVLYPYKMVKDLRTGYKTSLAEAVLDGDLEGFIEAEVRAVL